MSQKVLVTGATGLLGRAVAKQFEAAGWTVTGTGFSRASPPKTLKVDLTSADEVQKLLDEVKPSVIVHCAADRSPDSCSANPEAAKAINVAAPSTLASLSSSRGILLIYISTDYVFPGVPGEAPYASTATPRPTNIYGELKLDGERAAFAAAEANNSPSSVVALRLPVLYGKEDPPGNYSESAVNVLVDAVWKSQKPDASVSMDDWAIRYPTNTEDVARVCKDIATKYLSSSKDEPLPNILQFSAEENYTKYEICQLFAEILGLPLENMKANKQGNDPNSKAQRPYDAHLSMADLKQLGINVQAMDFKGWWRWHLKAVRK